MKKAIRLVILTLVAIFMMSIATSAIMEVTVSVDGVPVSYKDNLKPYITEKGKTVVPLAKTLADFGAKVNYNQETNEITVAKGDVSVIVPIGKQYIKVNNKFLILNEPTKLIKGIAIVEIAPLMRSLRYAVNYDPKSKNVNLENTPVPEPNNLIDAVPPWAENPVLEEKQIDKKLVALTYDDGPNGESTTIILDVLKENNAKATFFMLGKNVYNFKEQAIRTANEGHELANHSYSHPQLTKLSVARINQEIQGTQKAISSVTGITPKLLRVPYGAFNQTVKNNAGLPLIQWNIDTLDWKTRSAKKTIDAVLNNVKDGDIVLMHSIHISTAEATKTIVPELIKRGYTLVTISELAEARGVKLQNGKVYNSFRK